MELQRIAYCGVDCYECGSYKRGACTGCRAAEWEEDDICKPVACCRAKGISFCRECGEFPCEEMRAFYEESENHRRAYRRMRGEEVGECDSSLLDLVGFDGKCVRVTMTDGQVLEGICCHNSADYGEWELGNREESLQLLNYVVYSGSIKKVESLEVDGKPVDPKKKYGVATVDFLLDGGDNISVARGATKLIITDVVIGKAIEQYVRNLTAEGKAIEYQTDGRVVVK